MSHFDLRPWCIQVLWKIGCKRGMQHMHYVTLIWLFHLDTKSAIQCEWHASALCQTYTFIASGLKQKTHIKFIISISLSDNINHFNIIYQTDIISMILDKNINQFNINHSINHSATLGCYPLRSSQIGMFHRKFPVTSRRHKKDVPCHPRDA